MDDFAQTAALWLICGFVLMVPIAVAIALVRRRRNDKDLAKRSRRAERRYDRLY